MTDKHVEQLWELGFTMLYTKLYDKCYGNRHLKCYGNRHLKVTFDSSINRGYFFLERRFADKNVYEDEYDVLYECDICDFDKLISKIKKLTKELKYETDK